MIPFMQACPCFNLQDPECYKVPQMGSQEGSVGFVMEYRAPEVPANRVENDTQESPPKAATQLHKMWYVL